MTESRQTQEDRRHTTIDTRRLAAQTGLEVLTQRLQAIDAELAVLETQGAALRTERDLLMAQQQALEQYLHTIQERRDPGDSRRQASDYEHGALAGQQSERSSARVRCARCGTWLDREAGVPTTVEPDGTYRLWTPERAASFERYGQPHPPTPRYLCQACDRDLFADVGEGTE